MKPANYLVAKDYKLKLGDFGLAAFNDEALRQKKGICGTPNYLAPEVIQRHNYSFEVDLWATGVIM
jgi:serine/threonine protein kinase